MSNLIFDNKKVCSQCKEAKQIQEFPTNGKRGYHSFCRPCLRAASNKYKKDYPEKDKAKQRIQQIQRYGLTVESHTKMLEEQGGVCAICGKGQEVGRQDNLHIDHSHLSGAVRGLLCHYCNMALGKFKDSIPLLLEALSYLKKHKS